MHLPRLAFVAALSLVPFASAQEAAQIEDFTFEVTTLDGEKLTHEDLREQVVLVDFWGTWCGPCREMLPALKKLHLEYHEQGLAIVGLAYEREEDDADKLQTLRAFATQHEIPYRLALGTEEIQAQVPGFRGYPTLLVFRKGMRCAAVLVGAHPYEDLERMVKVFVKEKSPAEQKEDLPVRATLQLAGERRLEIGGGRAVLVVLEHPRLRLPEAQRQRVRELAAARGQELELVHATRGDLVVAGSKADELVPIAKEELAKIDLGRAFPLIALFDAGGRRVFVGAGRGPKTVAALEAALAEHLPVGATPREEVPTPPEKSGGEEPAKEPAKEPAGGHGKDPGAQSSESRRKKL